MVLACFLFGAFLVADDTTGAMSSLLVAFVASRDDDSSVVGSLGDGIGGGGSDSPCSVANARLHDKELLHIVDDKL